jgi:hypothetical protein
VRPFTLEQLPPAKSAVVQRANSLAVFVPVHQAPRISKGPAERARQRRRRVYRTVTLAAADPR